MALKWAQDEMDLLLSGNQPFKWEKTVKVMQQVNDLASLIRKSPAALLIIPDPKSYTTEMNMALEKAADETYTAGLELLGKNSRETAREAYGLFLRTEDLVPGYKENDKLLRESKMKGSLHVVMESIPVHAAMYQLSSEFFYDQVFEYLNKQYPEKGFIRFYSPNEFKYSGMEDPDMILHLEFFDFAVGNQQHSESEKEVSNMVKANPKDTLSKEMITKKAKFKTIDDKIISGGVVELKIFSLPSGRLLLSDRMPGEYVWFNQYAIYVGDKEALTKEQLDLARNKVVAPPPAQALFVEFTRPIFQQLTGRLNSFFRDFK